MNYIFYHSVDLDGHCSGAAARIWHEDNNISFTMVPITHGEECNISFNKSDRIYSLDYVLPNIEEYCDVVDEITVIDHHNTALYLKDHPQIKGIIDVNLAACELAWQWFFNNIPYGVQLLGIYDSWRNEDEEYWNEFILPFQYAMRSFYTDPCDDEAMKIWRKFYENRLDVDDIVTDGKAILRFTNTEAIKRMKRSFPFEMDGLRFIACVGAKGSRDFASVWNPDKYDAMMTMTHMRDYWAVSIFTDKDIDLSQVAKKRGGGGHKRAAGFQVNNLESFLHNV